LEKECSICAVALDRIEQLVVAKGFGQKLNRTRLQRLYRHRDVAMAPMLSTRPTSPQLPKYVSHAFGSLDKLWKPGHLRSACAAICCHRFRSKNMTEDIFIAEILGHNLLQGQPLSPSPKATKIFTSKVSCFLTKNPFARKEQLMHQPQRVNSRNGIKLPSA